MSIEHNEWPRNNPGEIEGSTVREDEHREGIDESLGQLSPKKSNLSDEEFANRPLLSEEEKLALPEYEITADDRQAIIAQLGETRGNTSDYLRYLNVPATPGGFIKLKWPDRSVTILVTDKDHYGVFEEHIPPTSELSEEEIAGIPALSFEEKELLPTIDLTARDEEILTKAHGEQVTVPLILKFKGIGYDEGYVKLRRTDGSVLIVNTVSEFYGDFTVESENAGRIREELNEVPHFSEEEEDTLPLIEFTNDDHAALLQAYGEKYSLEKLLKRKGIRPGSGYIRLRRADGSITLVNTGLATH